MNSGRQVHLDWPWPWAHSKPAATFLGVKTLSGMVHRAPGTSAGAEGDPVSRLAAAFAGLAAPQIHVHVKVDATASSSSSSSDGAIAPAADRPRRRHGPPEAISLADCRPGVLGGRCYVVWEVPGEDLAGIHGGAKAYKGLEERFPGGKYETGCGVRFCSAATFGEAVKIYIDRYQKDGGPWPPTCYRWA